MKKHNETVMVWEAPKIEKPEFRLYYDDAGRVLFYTSEKPEGKFLVIDTLTYAIGNPNLRIVDGHISDVVPGQIVSKLVPASTGVRCAEEDVSIVVDADYDGNTIQWELKTYEL
ncbi:MAG: hypothetical protein WCR20_11640 [Verrucomicrobiota bacterium]